MNGRSFGGGIPVERYLEKNGINDPELKDLSYENRLARVKELTGKNAGAGSSADTRGNVVVLDASQDIGKLAHELTHLRLANQYEGGYRTIADNLKSEPVKAEQQFLQIRAEMESPSPSG